MCLTDGFSTKDVVYKWSSNVARQAVRFPEGFTLSQFTLENYRVFEKNSSYETGNIDCSGILLHTRLNLTEGFRAKR